MIFKNKPLSQSVVMKEFEKIAINKGMAKAEVFSKTASDENNLNPTNDLIIDMINLADGLRAKGFIKDAESLETKVLAFKSAETHLYRAIDEDADDLLDFAHPKKNQVKFEAKDGHGEFEDTRSQHKKMVDIVNKKVASKYENVLGETAELLGLKKKADLDAIGEKIANINFYKNKLNELLNKQVAFYFVSRNSILAGTDDVLYVGDAHLGVGIPLIEGNSASKGDSYSNMLLTYFKNSSDITSSIWQSFLSGDESFDKIVSDEDVNHANKNLEHLYAEFLNKIHNLPVITRENAATETSKFIDGVHSLFDENSGFIIKALTSNDGKLENKIRMEIIPTILNNVKELQNLAAPKTTTGMDEIFDAGWVNVIAGRFDSLFNDATNAKNSDPGPLYFKKVADIIRANVNKPYSSAYNNLKAFDNDLASCIDKSKLDLRAQEWQNAFQKKASINNILTKKSALPGQLKNVGPTIPASVVRPVQNRPQHNSVAPKAVSTFQQNNPEEYDAVSKMQTAIHTLANSLNVLFPKESSETLANWASALTSTGYGSKGPKAEPIDGEWGPATEQSLKVAQTILAKLGVKEPLTTTAQRVKGQAVNDSKDIIAQATANLNQIQQTLIDHNVDFKGKDKVTPVEDDNSPYVDSLPANTNVLGAVTTVEDPQSGISLSKNDLGSFYGLFKFLRINGLTEVNGYNVKDWESILRWFHQRANQQLIETKKKSKAAYKLLLENLYGKLEDYVHDHPNSNEIVSAQDLDGKTSSVKKTGPTSNAIYNPDAEGVDEQSSNVNKLYPAPFGYKFDLTNLHNSYGTVMNSYDNYSYLLNDVTFDVQDFGYDPKSIATTYIKLPIESILKLNKLDPNSTVPNLNIKGKPITYSQLMTYFTTNPYVVNIKSKAYDYALYQVCSGLLNDLSNVMAYWKRNTNHTQQSSDYMDTAWKKWSDTLTRTLGRINQDVAQNGFTPSLQGSY